MRMPAPYRGRGPLSLSATDTYCVYEFLTSSQPTPNRPVRPAVLPNGTVPMTSISFDAISKFSRTAPLQDDSTFVLHTPPDPAGQLTRRWMLPKSTRPPSSA